MMLKIIVVNKNKGSLIALLLFYNSFNSSKCSIAILLAKSLWYISESHLNLTYGHISQSTSKQSASKNLFLSPRSKIL